MVAKESVRTVEEWLDLPELIIPTLNDDAEKGAVHNVLKVGFGLVSPEDCIRKGVKAQRGQGNRCLLPTAVIEVEGERQFYRLPIQLTSWAAHNVEKAHSGTNLFPSRVEFGVLKGRVYAEFIL